MNSRSGIVARKRAPSNSVSRERRALVVSSVASGIRFAGSRGASALLGAAACAATPGVLPPVRLTHRAFLPSSLSIGLPWFVGRLPSILTRLATPDTHGSGANVCVRSCEFSSPLSSVLLFSLILSITRRPFVTVRATICIETKDSCSHFSGLRQLPGVSIKRFGKLERAGNGLVRRLRVFSAWQFRAVGFRVMRWIEVAANSLAKHLGTSASVSNVCQCGSRKFVRI